MTATTLTTALVWNPHACKNGNPRRRGALEGTLLGVPVNGRTIGRGVAFQFELATGAIHTAWWDGTLDHFAPVLFDIDTHERLPLFSPEAFVWFDLLDNVIARIKAERA
jgi:hypothetical protein